MTIRWIWLVPSWIWVFSGVQIRHLGAQLLNPL